MKAFLSDRATRLVLAHKAIDVCQSISAYRHNTQLRQAAEHEARRILAEVEPEEVMFQGTMRTFYRRRLESLVYHGGANQEYRAALAEALTNFVSLEVI